MPRLNQFALLESICQIKERTGSIMEISKSLTLHSPFFLKAWYTHACIYLNLGLYFILNTFIVKLEFLCNYLKIWAGVPPSWRGPAIMNDIKMTCHFLGNMYFDIFKIKQKFREGFPPLGAGQLSSYIETWLPFAW